ncbi:Uncharacterised protein [Vibrio cholerae]|nr:Uncharacterised protein [Vibrio cholerae]
MEKQPTLRFKMLLNGQQIRDQKRAEQSKNGHRNDRMLPAKGIGE